MCVEVCPAPCLFRSDLFASSGAYVRAHEERRAAQARSRPITATYSNEAMIRSDAVIETQAALIVSIWDSE